MATDGKRVRPKVGQTLDDWIETSPFVQNLLDSLENSTKKVSVGVTCKHCKRMGRYYVDVPDDPRRVDAFLKIAEFVEGKAATVDTERGGLTLIVETTWPPDTDADPAG